MNRWRSLLSVLLALWLPLQGYAAVAMPFCQHSMASDSTHSARAGNAHHSEHRHDSHADMSRDDAQDRIDAHTAVDKASDLACNNCGACHLACAPAISTAVSVPLLITGSVLEAAPTDSPHFFYPELPQRPPLSALV